MPYLYVQTGADAGERLPLAGDNSVLGREPDTLQVSDKAASRRHAEIFRVGELCFLKDLDSKNGTFLNGSQVQEEILKSGDQIRIGTTVYIFVDEGAEGLSLGVQFGKEKDRDTTLLTGPAQLPDTGVTAQDLQIEALREVVRDLTAIHDRATLRRRILEVLAHATQSEFGYFFVTGKEGEEFRGLAHCGNVQDVSVSKSILAHALKTGQAVMTEDAATDDRFRGKQSVMLRKIHSVLCVPVGKSERSQGLLYFGRDLVRNPFTQHEMRLASLMGDMATMALESAFVQETQQELLLTTARALVRAMEWKQPEMKGHSERVSALSLSIAKALDLPFEECRKIQLGGLLHDIGRLTVWQDAGAETAAEAAHVYMGEQLLDKIPELADLKPAISFHHERSDGSGFPRKVKADKIPVMGRVVALANELDRLVSRGGAQGTGMLLKEALIRLGQSAGKEFDPSAVRGLLVAYRRGALHGVLYAAGQEGSQ